MGSLKLLIDRKETVIANSTYNTILITDPPNNDAAILILGTTYSGCMLHGPGLNFSSSVPNTHPIPFGPCPLIQGPCAQNDILFRTPTDYCLHEPCMQKGTCISKSDTYEVACYCKIDHYLPFLNLFLRYLTPIEFLQQYLCLTITIFQKNHNFSAIVQHVTVGKIVKSIRDHLVTETLTRAIMRVGVLKTTGVTLHVAVCRAILETIVKQKSVYILYVKTNLV